MKNSICLFLLGTLLSTATAQVYVDPATAGATAAQSSMINKELNKTTNNLTLIERGQLAVTGQLVIVNDLQRQIYKGLSEVSGAVKSLIAVRDIVDTGFDIVEDVNKALAIAKQQPQFLLFAEQGAREFKRRSIALSAEVNEFILLGGAKNLMDSGERAKLLNKIRTELMIIRGVAYGMHRSMFWAQQKGFLKSLNPYAGYLNIDSRIADDIVRNAKYLKQ